MSKYLKRDRRETHNNPTIVHDHNLGMDVKHLRHVSKVMRQKLRVDTEQRRHTRSVLPQVYQAIVHQEGW